MKEPNICFIISITGVICTVFSVIAIVLIILGSVCIGTDNFNACGNKNGAIAMLVIGSVTIGLELLTIVAICCSVLFACCICLRQWDAYANLQKSKNIETQTTEQQSNLIVV